MECVRENPDAGGLGLVSVPRPHIDPHLPRHQLSDVADGLSHLHSRIVIHGDLKGASDYSGSRRTIVLTPTQSGILVDDTSHARIADFGLAARSDHPKPEFYLKWIGWPWIHRAMDCTGDPKRAGTV